jgi:hypothetical protein
VSQSEVLAVAACIAEKASLTTSKTCVKCGWLSSPGMFMHCPVTVAAVLVLFPTLCVATTRNYALLTEQTQLNTSRNKQLVCHHYSSVA